MKIKLAYGEKGLWVNVPRRNLLKVLEIKHTPPLRNLREALEKSLERPIQAPALKEIARGKKNACIVISDRTRPIPYKDILPPILKCLTASGLRKEDIVLLIATGIHRPMTKKEIDNFLGRDISNRFRIINHFSRRKRGHIYLGRTRRGAPVYIGEKKV